MHNRETNLMDVPNDKRSASGVENRSRGHFRFVRTVRAEAGSCVAFPFTGTMPNMRHPVTVFGTCVAVVVACVLAGCRTGSPCAAAASHPPDATPFNGHWYKVFDEKIPWEEARARCVKMGGYLACIETEAEQKFIARFADGRYLFLGASDEKKEDEWIWVNGCPFTYTCWMGGQPNNYGGSENYLATYDGGEWVDVDSEGSGFWMPTGFICEWEK